MIKYLILDVDGTLTDGGVYYDEHGNEIKKFNTKDGTGFVCARSVGIGIIVITGRICEATQRRMEELKAEKVFQDVKDKAAFLKKWMEENGVSKEQVGYIGDDLNDLAPMSLCGYVGCPADAAPEVKAVADYISPVKGGYGAVRDVIEAYLRSNGMWETVLKKTYGAGI